MDKMLASILVTLFGIWVAVDLIFWLLPEDSMYRDGVLPHVRLFNLVGIALAIALGGWLLISGARRINSRSRKGR